jgi:hypothetical protein
MDVWPTEAGGSILITPSAGNRHIHAIEVAHSADYAWVKGAPRGK